MCSECFDAVGDGFDADRGDEVKRVLGAEQLDVATGLAEAPRAWSAKSKGKEGNDESWLAMPP